MHFVFLQYIHGYFFIVFLHLWIHGHLSESGLSLFIFSLLSSSSAISSSLSTSCVYRRAASLPLILPSPTPPHQTFILYCGSFTLILFPYLLFPGPFLPSSLVPPQSRHLLPDPPFNPSYSLHPPTHSPLPHPSVASQEAERTELRYMKVTSNETYPRWAAYAERTNLGSPITKPPAPGPANATHNRNVSRV